MSCRDLDRAAWVTGGGAGYDGYLAGFFASVQPVATLSNRPGSTTRNGAACIPAISPRAQLWPLLRHYD